MSKTKLQKQHYDCPTETYTRTVDGNVFEVVMPLFDGPRIDLGYEYNNPDFWESHFEKDSGGAAQIAAAKRQFTDMGYDVKGKAAHHLPSNPGECHIQLVDAAEHKNTPHYGGMSINNDTWLRKHLK